MWQIKDLELIPNVILSFGICLQERSIWSSKRRWCNCTSRSTLSQSFTVDTGRLTDQYQNLLGQILWYVASYRLSVCVFINSFQSEDKYRAVCDKRFMIFIFISFQWQLLREKTLTLWTFKWCRFINLT